MSEQKRRLHQSHGQHLTIETLSDDVFGYLIDFIPLVPDMQLLRIVCKSWNEKISKFLSEVDALCLMDYALVSIYLSFCLRIYIYNESGMTGGGRGKIENSYTKTSICTT